MLYLIGLGLNEKSLSLEGLEAIKKCHHVYLEGYTVDFPYKTEELEKTASKKIEVLMRDKVENNNLINQAKKEDVALLIYGSPLFATTHQTLIEDCRKAKVQVKVIHSASIFDALAETGLQLYKFGKITSMPKWQKSFTPDSFLDIVRENNSIKAHSIILVDIGLKFQDALMELKEAAVNKKIKLDKLIICSSMGTKAQKIIYSSISELEKLKNEEIKLPFCIIIPSEMHFMEQDTLERFRKI
jgi:diphthine synthase